MTQLVPSVSSGNGQMSRNGMTALKCVLGVVVCLACLLFLMPGTSEAKGGGRGGHSHAHRNSSGRTNRHPKHHHPVQKHKHKHKHKKNDGDSDGGDDGGGDDGGDGGDEGDGGGSSDGGAAEGTGAAEAAEATEPVVVVYGMEITALYKGAASKGGLEIGDIILSVNGTSTPTFEALAQTLAQSGNRAQVVVVRQDGGERETVTLVPQNGYIGVSVEPARVE